jgi:glycosyltransferase involved in cell wall biosynthesis
MANLNSTRAARIVLLLEDLKFGGTQRHALELARGLDRRRFQPEIWTLAAGDDFSPVARAWGIPVTQLSRQKMAGPATLARLWLRFKKSPPDLLLTLTAVPNIWGRVLGRWAGAPLVVGNVRSLTHHRQHEGWLWPFADHILCNTKAINDKLNNDCKISLSRITVIPNGVDMDYFQPQSPGPAPKPVILSVGRLVLDKDQETLIRAFRLAQTDHPDAELWLVGDGPRKQVLETLATRLLPPGKVRFLPGQTDLRPLFAQAAIFALSSRHEAFPNVALEAMAMGLPVVATRVGGLPDLVTPGESGWLTPPGNAAALAGAISQLLGDPETRQAFGRAGRQRVERDFTLEAMVRRHEEVFATLLAPKCSPKAPGKEAGAPLPPVRMTGARELAGPCVDLASPVLPPKSSPRVAYFLLWFPEPTQTFILDEVNTLCRLGLDLKVYSFYGARASNRVAGMEQVLAPVERLGLASLGPLILHLLRLFRDHRPLARLVLAETLVRKWRSLETGGEALWAALAGAYLGPRLQAELVDHIHAPWANGPATGAWAASRFSGIPFSFCGHAHDIYPPDGALEEKIQAASFIRVISEVNRNYLLALAPDAADKFTVIRYGVPLTPVPAPPRLPGPPFQLLSIGRMVPKKGFPVLLGACRALAAQGLDFHLTLAGDGPQSQELQELVRDYGLASRVSFPGFVPHRRVPALLHRADLFILPCIVDPQGDRDGIPNVILEAMAHEVPVVSTDVSGVIEAVVPGKTGWIAPPGDPQALAEAIREALENPAEARRRGQAGKRWVAREFDSVKNYGKLKTWLEKYS